ncbi:MAG: endonuclease/exonuclease/phosphatase family protein, partial [Phycisphaeraceae bacterium]|nr:endonuclease/exonuclease/phosphatase family protein [Phycisphaeraceae bacterium]
GSSAGEVKDIGTGDRIMIDGDFQDWAGQPNIVADEHFLYILLDLGYPATLQSSIPTRLLLDLDDEATTGRHLAIPVAGREQEIELGADVEVVFSPPRVFDDGRVTWGTGVSVLVHGAVADEPVRIGHHDVGVIFSPTYAGRKFEVRLDRRRLHEAWRAAVPADGDDPGPSTRISAAFKRSTLDGRVFGHSLLGSDVRLPAAATSRIPTGEIPDRPEGFTRVMTYNVLWSTPAREPEPFARTIRAVDPDVLLFQEWDQPDQEILNWLNTYIGGGDWKVVSGHNGVAVATRLEIEPVIEELQVPPARPRRGESPGEPRPIRFVAAQVTLPSGEKVLFGSPHLKCCGSINDEADRTRMDETSIIAAEIRALPVEQRRRLLIGGDYNLVGSRDPLRNLKAQLDADGSDLAIVPTPVTGENAVYTWFEEDNRFSPGRLDWITYTDSTLEAINGVALDLRQLSPEILRRHNLRPEYGQATDHLPLIVDIRPRPKP